MKEGKKEMACMNLRSGSSIGCCFGLEFVLGDPGWNCLHFVFLIAEF